MENALIKIGDTVQYLSDNGRYTSACEGVVAKITPKTVVLECGLRLYKTSIKVFR